MVHITCMSPVVRAGRFGHLVRGGLARLHAVTHLATGTAPAWGSGNWCDFAPELHHLSHDILPPLSSDNPSHRRM
jgi:hypothetical protein